MTTKGYAVTYPPEFDGELHVKVTGTFTDVHRYATVQFSIACRTGETELQAAIRGCNDFALWAARKGAYL